MTGAQKKKIRRIMIAAPKSGSGKTTITCGLLQIFKENGEDISSCKCGPDYIDPMFHRQVLGVPSRNLDTFFTGEEGTRKLFLKDRREDELVVMEGVMGLYDGLGGIREEGSSYHLAKVTQTPILLVVDAKGMGRSVIPLIAGFLAYDKAHLIRGVIFNRMSAAYYEILKPLAEDELGIAVLGYFEIRPADRQQTLRLVHAGRTGRLAGTDPYDSREITGDRRHFKTVADRRGSGAVGGRDGSGGFRRNQRSNAPEDRCSPG